MEPKSVLAFDIDGTLTKRNTYNILPQGLATVLNTLSKAGHFFLPVTGKPIAYVSRLIQTNHLTDRGIIAENAGVYRKPESETIEIFEKESVKAICELKEMLGLVPSAGNICDIFIEGRAHKMPVDPEDHSILTLFTDPKFISHRWQFEQTITTEEVFDFLQKIVQDKWDDQLKVIPPFPDGGIQVIRKTHTGRIIDKSLIVDVIKIMFEMTEMPPIAMFGDGHNDVPAMTPKEVTAITFSNAHPLLIDFVKNKKGYISQSLAPDNYGTVEGLYWLVKTNFFKEDSNLVKRILDNTFKDRFS